MRELKKVGFPAPARVVQASKFVMRGEWEVIFFFVLFLACSLWYHLTTESLPYERSRGGEDGVLTHAACVLYDQ